MSTAPVQLDEEALIREIIAAIPLPEGVKFKRLEPMIESTGEDAWRVRFTVSKRVPLTKRRVHDLNAIGFTLFNNLLPLQLGKWPFVKFEEVK